MDVEFYWHIHHEVLLEPTLEPIKHRREYIHKRKPLEEQELRLRLLKPVRGKLPDAMIQAGSFYCDAWGGFSKTVYQESWDALLTSLEDHRAEIEALHAEECPDCPWDGETIFPEGGAE